MHYAAMVITKEFPSVLDLDKILEPYYEENLYSEEDSVIQKPLVPMFTYDWYQIGGRYSGRLKLGIDYDKKEYEWDYYARNPRNQRLFHSSLLSKITGRGVSEEDCFQSMGENDGFIYVDGAKINDINNFKDISCFYCIDTVNTNVAMKEYWDGNHWIKNENFNERLKQIKDNCNNGYVTIVDMHS